MEASRAAFFGWAYTSDMGTDDNPTSLRRRVPQPLWCMFLHVSNVPNNNSGQVFTKNIYLLKHLISYMLIAAVHICAIVSYPTLYTTDTSHYAFIEGNVSTHFF